MPNPDKQYKEYYKENPVGNHYPPSDETLRFMKKQEKINELLVAGITEIKVHLAKQDEKLTAIHEQVIRTNGRVTENENFRKENGDFLQSMKEERKEIKSKFMDYVIRALVFGLIALIAGLAGGSVEKVIGLF